METIRLVCATRKSHNNFFSQTALGRSFLVYRRLPFVELKLFADNRTGLSTVYNFAIEETKEDSRILVFVHDDVHLVDLFWPFRVFNALEAFDIVGVAGNRRRVERQPAWCFTDEALTWDSNANLSGFVGHGKGFPCELSTYGTPGHEVKLLDGALMIARGDMLHQKNLRFDPRFDFHFYDMDFCRQAEEGGVRMGTWTIGIIHESGGNFKSPAWQENYARYLAKWGS